MISLHCTKKLTAKLLFDEKGFLPSKNGDSISNESSTSTSPLSGWHANLLTIQRRNCILMVHDITRFPLLMTGLTKKEFAHLDFWFCDALMNTLLKINAIQRQMDAAAHALQPLRVDNDCNRSVQGTLNRAKGDFEHMLRYEHVSVEDVSAYGTAAWLAEAPCNVKGQKDCIWPIKAMLRLLDQIAEGMPASEIPESKHTIPELVSNKNGSLDSINAEPSNVVPTKDYHRKISTEKIRKRDD